MKTQDFVGRSLTDNDPSVQQAAQHHFPCRIVLSEHTTTISKPSESTEREI